MFDLFSFHYFKLSFNLFVLQIGQDSNPYPTHLECVILPIKLPIYIKKLKFPNLVIKELLQIIYCKNELRNNLFNHIAYVYLTTHHLHLTTLLNVLNAKLLLFLNVFNIFVMIKIVIIIFLFIYVLLFLN